MNEQLPPADQNERQPVLELANALEIARWLADFIANAAITGVIGSIAYDTLKTWKRRFGRDRVRELQTLVYEELKRVKRKPNVSDQDLHNRATALFQDYEDD